MVLTVMGYRAKSFELWSNLLEAQPLLIVDYVKPSARKKPDKLIIHVGTNDLTNSIVNTTENDLEPLVTTVLKLKFIFPNRACIEPCRVMADAG